MTPERISPPWKLILLGVVLVSLTVLAVYEFPHHHRVDRRFHVCTPSDPCSIG